MEREPVQKSKLVSVLPEEEGDEDLGNQIQTKLVFPVEKLAAEAVSEPAVETVSVGAQPAAVKVEGSCDSGIKTTMTNGSGANDINTSSHTVAEEVPAKSYEESKRTVADQEVEIQKPIELVIESAQKLICPLPADDTVIEFTPAVSESIKESSDEKSNEVWHEEAFSKPEGDLKAKVDSYNEASVWSADVDVSNILQPAESKETVELSEPQERVEQPRTVDKSPERCVNSDQEGIKMEAEVKLEPAFDEELTVVKQETEGESDPLPEPINEVTSKVEALIADDSKEESGAVQQTLDLDLRVDLPVLSLQPQLTQNIVQADEEETPKVAEQEEDTPKQPDFTAVYPRLSSHKEEKNEVQSVPAAAKDIEVKLDDIRDVETRSEEIRTDVPESVDVKCPAEYEVKEERQTQAMTLDSTVGAEIITEQQVLPDVTEDVITIVSSPSTYVEQKSDVEQQVVESSSAPEEAIEETKPLSVETSTPQVETEEASPPAVAAENRDETEKQVIEKVLAVEAEEPVEEAKPLPVEMSIPQVETKGASPPAVAAENRDETEKQVPEKVLALEAVAEKAESLEVSPPAVSAESNGETEKQVAANILPVEASVEEAKSSPVLTTAQPAETFETSPTLVSAQHEEIAQEQFTKSIAAPVEEAAASPVRATAPPEELVEASPTSTSSYVVLESGPAGTVAAVEEPPVYCVKWIMWKGLETPVVTQNVNGPCPLLAIANVLLLKRQITLPAKADVVTSARLLELIGDTILESVPKNIVENVKTNYEQNVSDALSILPKLQSGIDVNVKFTGISDFEYTPELALFDLVHIPLYHGWLVDRAQKDEVDAVGSCGYNQLVERIITAKSQENQDLFLKAEIAEAFLERTASQLTYQGLLDLSSAVQDDELAVFFRNNHFSTLYKTQNQLFILVTDQGLLQESKIVWETLQDIDGSGQFVDANFTVDGKPLAGFTKDEQIGRDFQIAAQLQREADELQETSRLSKDTTPLSDEELARQLQKEEEKRAGPSSSGSPVSPASSPREARSSPPPQQAPPRREEKKSFCIIM